MLYNVAFILLDIKVSIFLLISKCHKDTYLRLRR